MKYELAGDVGVHERLRFVEQCKSQEWSRAEVCRRFEISHRTGYKSLDQCESGGLQALKDGSRAPHHDPRRVPKEVEDAIVKARGKRPHWAPVELRVRLGRTAPAILSLEPNSGDQFVVWRGE